MNLKHSQYCILHQLLQNKTHLSWSPATNHWNKQQRTLQPVAACGALGLSELEFLVTLSVWWSWPLVGIGTACVAVRGSSLLLAEMSTAMFCVGWVLCCDTACVVVVGLAGSLSGPTSGGLTLWTSMDSASNQDKLAALIATIFGPYSISQWCMMVFTVCSSVLLPHVLVNQIARIYRMASAH